MKEGNPVILYFDGYTCNASSIFCIGFQTTVNILSFVFILFRRIARDMDKAMQDRMGKTEDPYVRFLYITKQLISKCLIV
jgi:hypothetical protein